MGSGETAPTMVTPHRDIVARLGDVPPRAVLLDTPYGFQENGPEITQKAVEYFAKRVQLTIDAAGYPGPLAADPAQRTAGAEAGALSRLRTANSSSPGRAVRPTRSRLAGLADPRGAGDPARRGRGLVFASAAALTLGRFTIPVYEIYKAGQPVQWLEGLDLMTASRLRGLVRRHPPLRQRRGRHARHALLLHGRAAAGRDGSDAPRRRLGARRRRAHRGHHGSRRAYGSVTGRGALTVRRRAIARFAAGEQLDLDTLKALARGETAAPERAAAASRTTRRADRTAPAARAPEGALATAPEADRLEQTFGSALTARKAGEAAEAILHLDRTIQEWAADSLQSDEPDRARAILHSLVHRLGEAAAAGVRDPRERLAPLVESLITLRKELRAAKAWELADRVRDRLTAAHIEVRDTPAGTEWDLRE